MPLSKPRTARAETCLPQSFQIPQRTLMRFIAKGISNQK
jgi:hypothetical protein